MVNIPNLFFKVDPHWLLSQALTSLEGFPRPRHRIFKIPPVFLSCRSWVNSSDPAELPQEPAQGCRGGLHRVSTIFSASSLCFLCRTGMAVGASKEWKWNASVFTALGRGSEFCGTNAGQISLRATARGLNVPLGSGAQSIRVRRYEYWQLTELKALFHYLSQDLCSKQSQNKIPNNYDIKPGLLFVLLSSVLLSPKEMLNWCHEVLLW